MSYSVRYYYDKFFSGIIDNVVNVNEESRLFFFWQAIISRRNKIACSLFVNIPFSRKRMIKTVLQIFVVDKLMLVNDRILT